ncbi:hypothetical protein [Gellertiella hungarica]|uniref:Uncharacterized protein n=1 Tax=Gellertiella hungarica TaxID=1572859 RepID=A0A7W6J7Z2_9HYPH|nr:hypothetical protein [Gellertiella hungarica]MBB4066480.1 hypothetical protein [Gellertiella hungarica]
MRLVLRFASFLLLVAAVFAATLDTITSVADSGMSLTSLQMAWNTIDPQSLSRVETGVLSAGLPASLNGAIQWTLGQPAFAVALALSLLFWVAGYRRLPAAGRFAA